MHEICRMFLTIIRFNSIFLLVETTGKKRGMKYLLLIIAFLCSLVEVDAQNLKGRIVDRNQRPIEGANIFVRNMLQGVAANENGEFQLHLPAGNYTCEVTAIGYEKRTIQVTVSERPLQMDWVLQPMTYLLPEVRVSNKGEDPAYSIMRQAIALAPFHRNQVKRYTAEVYTKGKAQIEKVPKVYLMGVSSENRKKINTSIGKLLVLESVTEVKFEAPAHYEDKVLAFNSTIPEEIDPSEALSIITASIYDPSIMGMISPLSPGAFSQYRFRLMESYLQDGKAVNKIKVEPKKKNLQLFAGELHIEDQGWSVVNFDLTAEVFNSDARFKVIFHELTDGVYLPTSYDIGVDVKFAGIVAGGRYYSSLKYSDVEAVKEEAGITAAVLPKEEQEPVTTKQKRTIEKLEELTQKEVLSTRDAYQVARLTQQVLDQSLRADTVSPLEVRSLGASYRIETDALAARRDSLFWQRYRTIPLNQEELLSYRNRDSIREIMLSDPDELPEPGRQRVSVGGKLMWGGTFRYNNGVRLRINGLLGVLSEYNFVDGFWLGQQTTFSFPMAPQRRFELNAGLHYVTARKSWVWNAGIVFPYALRQNGRLAIDAGDSSIDYKQETGSVRLENSLTSFVGGYNFLKFYRGQYLRFSNEIDLANGLRFSLGGKYEKRTPLENEISFNLFDKTPKSNVMTEWSPMPSHHSASLSAALSYNPRGTYL